MTMAVDKHNGGVDYSVHVVVLLAVVTSKDDESDVGKKFKKVSNLFWESLEKHGMNCCKMC